MERRDPVTAGDEQRLLIGRGRGEGPAQRAQALREIAWRERGQRAGARADRLQEQAKRLRGGVDGEDREGPAQGRLGGVPALIITNWPARDARATSACRSVRST